MKIDTTKKQSVFLIVFLVFSALGIKKFISYIFDHFEKFLLASKQINNLLTSFNANKSFFDFLKSIPIIISISLIIYLILWIIDNILWKNKFFSKIFLNNIPNLNGTYKGELKSYKRIPNEDRDVNNLKKINPYETITIKLK